MLPILAQLVVALVIGHPTPITCGPVSGGHSGWYNEQAQSILLADWMCPYYNLNPKDYRFSYAVLILVHEGEHAAGIVDEHKANCAAVKASPKVLKGTNIPAKVQKKIVHDAKGIAHGQPPPYGGPC